MQLVKLVKKFPAPKRFLKKIFINHTNFTDFLNNLLNLLNLSDFQEHFNVNFLLQRNNLSDVKNSKKKIFIK